MFHNTFDTMFDRMLTLSRAMDEAAVRSGLTEGDAARTQLWLPAIDVYETDAAFVLEADLPGVHQENVNIQFDKNAITISGTRGATLPAKDKPQQLRVFSAERLSGAFSRSVRLPDHVDAEKIEATYQDGVLSITVPKSAAARPRTIPIGTREVQPQIAG